MNKRKEAYQQAAKSNEELRIANDHELQLIHKAYLQMAKELVDMCQANNIYITLSGGSVLGAVRHHGFIPWDDDLDINISRKDYERFKRLFDDYFMGKYILNSPNHYQNRTSYRIGKIENPHIIIEESEEDRHGLIVDIFIIENIPDNKLKRLIFGLRTYFYMEVASLVWDYEKESKNPKLFFRRQIGRFFSFKPLNDWNDKIDKITRYSNEKTKMVGIPCGRNHYFGEIYTREALMKQEFVPFEGVLLPIPQGYDEYLTKLYGNYHSIPPEDKREHHYIKNIIFDQQ